MLLIDPSNAEAYLRRAGHVGESESVSVRELAGGVSNVVLLVSRSSRKDSFVLKQVREQLRVPEPWFCSIERIWREVDVLKVCHRAVRARPVRREKNNEPSIDVPRVLFADRENYLFAMTAAPEHEVWKSQLLRHELHASTAAACGRLLGTIHGATWQHPEISTKLADRSFFDALRLDPYYRHVARSHPDVAPSLDRLLQSLTDHPRCLVHGDFSPKNILVHRDGLTLVDFEVGHFGDPAFDLGFFLSHLILKAIRAIQGRPDFLNLTVAFWEAYRENMLPVCGSAEYGELIERGIQNLGGCLLARVDGKSRVDYLNTEAQDIVRRLARQILFEKPNSWPEVVTYFS